MKRIFSICILCIAAVSVSSAHTVELNLRVGETATFPTAVGSDGSLTYSGSTTGDGTSRVKAIGDVSGGQFTVPNKQFIGRLQWDSSTGLFSITGLKVEDSGQYRVKNDANPEKLYQLTVYVPVSKPIVTHDKASCTLHCTVERGTEVTLSWYREGEEESFVSYPVRSAPYLDMTEAVERSGTYTCEAVNSVSREKSSVTVGEECEGGHTGSNTGLIVGITVAAVFIIVAILLGILYYRQNKTVKALNKRIAALEGSKNALKTQGEGDE